MHYYKHNIGDYRRRTSHLSLLEHGIYRQLLDQYYLDEIPLISNIQKLERLLCVRNADEKQALCTILEEFFELTEDGYIHSHADKEISKYHEKSDKAAAAAAARWDKVKEKQKLSEVSEGNAVGMQTHSEGNANHKPITTNHKPIDIVDKSPSKKRFIKPSIRDIYAYCLERKNKINPQQFYDYYESIGWKVGKNPMKDWKATIRTWERKHEENGQRDTRSRGEKHNDILDRIARESLERESIGGTLGGGDIQKVQGKVYPQVDFGD